MFGFKKNLIKSMIKIETISNDPGELKLYAKQIIDIEDEYRVYEHFILDAIKILKGINDVKVDYDRGLVTIKYNESLVAAEEIYRWIDILIDISLDNKEFIKDNGEKDVNLVWAKLKPILEKRALEVKSRRD
ncbi:heavy-metal-associated domain-containing protein [Cellulosilyticum ruminicola]|uniref:heavy-metal-associated domain-containing protein n=1 Tax=Cellulosilyticum ruminicola TaxID=425254 RepID=UPI0006D179E4|nr:heavy-metal-associated domain-containing protein [Cellulosilyticum ruminicola]